jgi:hypothetical protein
VLQPLRASTATQPNRREADESAGATGRRGTGGLGRARGNDDKGCCRWAGRRRGERTVSKRMVIPRRAEAVVTAIGVQRRAWSRVGVDPRVLTASR